MRSFRASQIAALADSGWARCRSVADAVAGAGLPPVTVDYLRETFSAEQWHVAEGAVSALRDAFGSARFGEEIDYGTVLVPDPGCLDTRGPMDPAVRGDQLGSATTDVVDQRLGAGRLGVRPGSTWSLVATVTGAYGPALGSYLDIHGADPERFTIGGVDVRDLIIRQVCGARVLRSGSHLPDCEANQRWSFTLFPGEGLTDGLAESGTVLKGRVRFRLANPTAASARPASHPPSSSPSHIVCGTRSRGGGRGVRLSFGCRDVNDRGRSKGYATERSV